jgi:hypothetical protein
MAACAIFSDVLLTSAKLILVVSTISRIRKIGHPQQTFAAMQSNALV